MERQYTIVLMPEPEEGGCPVIVPALPGCVTHGLTVEECVDDAKGAIAVYVESLEAHGESVPPDVSEPKVLTIKIAA